MGSETSAVFTRSYSTSFSVANYSKVLRTYPKSRSQVGKVDQVEHGEREKKKRGRSKRRWLDEVTEKNGTQTRWHIKPSYK